MKRVLRWVVCVLALTYVPAPDAGAQERAIGSKPLDTPGHGT